MNSVVLNAGLVSSVRRTAPMRGSWAMGRPASTAMGFLLVAGSGRQAFPAWWAGQKRRVRMRTLRVQVSVRREDGAADRANCQAHAPLDLDRRHLLRPGHR